MKRIFSIILLTIFGFVTNVWADNISIENAKILQGGTQTIALNLDNTATDYAAFQMDVYLPQGLSIDKGNTSLTDRAETGGSITIGKQKDGAFRLVYSSLTLTPITGTSGTLVNLCLKASADFAGGMVNVKNITFGTTDSKTVKMNDVSFETSKATRVVVTGNTIKMQYGDAVPELTYQLNNDNVAGSPVLTCEATSTSPVGSYPIKVSQGSVGADIVECVDGTLIIEKAPLTISAGSYTKKQGDAMPTFKAAYAGFKNGETEAVLTKQPVFSTSATEASAPGDYPVTVSGAEAQNYDISYRQGTLTVTQADAVVITARSCTRQYGDNNPTFEYDVQGATLDGVPEITCEAVKNSPVGTYTIVVKQGTVRNYNVVLTNGTLTIEKAPLTISAGSYTKKQGDAMPTFKAAYAGFKNGETEAVLTKQPVFSTTATEASAPGDYPVTVSGAEAQNYDISYRQGTLTVTQADAVVITARSYTRQYGDNNPTFEYDVQGATLDGVPEITCEAVKNSPVGTYATVVKQGTVKNYNMVLTNGTLTIEKAPLTISAGSYTKKQGDAMPAFKAAYAGFKNGETEAVLTKQPVFSTTATEASAPGSYPVTVSGAEAQNYDISYRQGTLTVTQADAVVITARSYTRQYGDNNPTFEYDVQGATLDGVPEITCEAVKNSPVGTYAIVVKQGTVKNYNVVLTNGTLTIEKAPLTISVGSYTKKQGDAMPTFKAAYAGFKNGETEAVLTKQPVFSTTATEASAPGSYPVTVSGAEAQNYDISYQQGTLTVAQADAVVITARSYTRQYGDNNPTFEYNVQGATLDGVPEITCEAVKNSPVGTYAIVVKQGTVKNYNVVLTNGTLTIEKAPLTISAGSYTKKQGDAMPTFKAAYAGFKNGETEAVLTRQPVFSTTANENSEIGEYPVYVNGAEAQNYEISYQQGTLTVISPRLLAPVITITGNELSISTETKNVNIYYTLDGTNPDVNSLLYDGPISLCASCVIKAVAVYKDYSSDIAEAEYHDADYPDIVKVGDAVSANIIINGEENFPMMFEVTSVYPFDVTLVHKGHYVEGWDNSKLVGDIEIPATVTANGVTYNVKRIGDSALAYAPNVTSLKLNEGLEYIDGSAFRSMSRITEITIPNSVKNIGIVFMTECGNLQTVVLGSGLERIGRYQFWWVMSNSFKSIISMNPVPPIMDSPDEAFKKTYENFPNGMTLYVPIGSKEAYETAPGWNILAGHIVELNTTDINNSIVSVSRDTEAWYTLQGIKLPAKPAAAGIYIHGGKKVIVK